MGGYRANTARKSSASMLRWLKTRAWILLPVFAYSTRKASSRLATSWRWLPCSGITRIGSATTGDGRRRPGTSRPEVEG